MIPFLREGRIGPAASGLGRNTPKASVGTRSPMSSVKKLKLEGHWDHKSIGLPIATFNERVHSSFRIGFKDIS